MEYVVDIRNLNKSYNDFQLTNISLKIPKGTVLGIIGENGAGKSTFIRSMLGLIKADYEKMLILGKDFLLEEKQIKQDIAVIFDKTCYNLSFTPMMIGKILSNIYENWDMKKYIYYLERFHIPKKKRIKEFSKGMNMKMEFAIAFSHDPKLLILDEATSGLDPLFRDEILDLLREFTEDENHSIIMCSHITGDLDKIADYIAYIHKGKLLFIKTYDEIRNDYGIISCRKDIFETLREDDIVFYRKETYGYKVLVKNRREISNVFKDLEIENTTIEDIMLFYVKGERVV